MTVDSTYKPVNVTRTDEQYYPFEIESIGDSAMTVWVKEGGIRTQVPLYYFDPSGLNQGLIYENHLDPIKKRGKTKLSEALKGSQELQFRRKTPIKTDFDPQSLKRFNATTLEYELDVITFIQQEIEGHTCACPAYPPYIGEPEIPELTTPAPECQPYSCSSIAEYALARGFGFSHMSNMLTSVTLPADGYFPDDVSGGTNPSIPRARYRPSWAGRTLSYNSTNQAYSYLDPIDEEDRRVTWCDGENYRLILSSNPSSTTDSEQTIQYDDLITHQTLLHYGGLTQRPSGDNIFMIGTRWDFQHVVDSSSSPPAYVSNNANLNTGCDVFEGRINLITPSSVVLFENPIPWLAENATTVWVKVGEVYQEEGIAWDGNYNRPYFRAFAPYTVHCILNGDHRFYSGTYMLGGSWNVPLLITNTTRTMTPSLNGTNCHLKGMLFGTDDIDVDELILVIEQNSPDYRPPEYCNPTFPGDEI